MRDKKKDKEIIEFYKKHKKVRSENLIPPIPLTPEQTEAVCNMLISGNEEDIDWLKDLIVNRVSPGVDPSAKIKAAFLENITTGSVSVDNINKKEAVRILGTMLGGYNVNPLINALKENSLAEDAFKALREVILIYDDFNTIKEFSPSNRFAKKVLESWADGEWFLNKPEMPEEIKVKIYKVDGEINTDDFSPAGNAFSRSDIPLHALSMGQSLFPDGIETIRKWREEGHVVAFAGDVVGTGSSRKSATNSLLWHIGEDIPFIPNKKRTGIVLGGLGVGGNQLTGIFLGGLGVGGDDLTGVFLGGLGVGGNNLTGVMAGLGGVGGDHIEGAALALGYLKGESLTGLGVGGYNNVKETTGLSIGIFNRARVLKGIQIGLLNHAGNNPRGLQWLPGINAHF